MESKREVILAFLKTHGQATLGEIAAHLEVSKQGALRHLESLESSGLATVASALPHGRGRPENVYRLTPLAGEHFPDGHRELTGELVDFMTNEQLKAFVQGATAAATGAIAGAVVVLGLRSIYDVPMALIGLISLCVLWRFKPPGASDRCRRRSGRPIQDVAARTGLPCINEQHMYERLLGADVKRTTWMAEAADDCTYVMKENEKRVG